MELYRAQRRLMQSAGKDYRAKRGFCPFKGMPGMWYRKDMLLRSASEQTTGRYVHMETKGLLIRRRRMEDAEAWFLPASEKDVVLNAGFRPRVSLKDSRHFCESLLESRCVCGYT